MNKWNLESVIWESVVKFGGSSLADAKQFIKVKDIIKAEKSRRYVVPSAPGKRFSDDIKVTDMLYECHDLASDNKDISKVFNKIIERYNGIISDLGIDLSLDADYTEIKEKLVNHASRDFAASRGEYLNGKILASYLGYEFVDPAEMIVFDDKGVFLLDETVQIMRRRLKNIENAVIPGFYGAMQMVR